MSISFACITAALGISLIIHKIKGVNQKTSKILALKISFSEIDV